MQSNDTITFVVNGKTTRLTAQADTPLLYLLRNDLGLKATRFGCGNGMCGACSVIIDGRAVNSCEVPLWAVKDKSVETVEGLGATGNLHALQQAVLDEQAGQCGYCLSGIIMRAKGLLDENPKPTRAEIIEALDGNLCRCGAHGRIIRAIEKVANQPARQMSGAKS